MQQYKIMGLVKIFRDGSHMNVGDELNDICVVIVDGVYYIKSNKKLLFVNMGKVNNLDSEQHIKEFIDWDDSGCTIYFTKGDKGEVYPPEVFTLHLEFEKIREEKKVIKILNTRDLFHV
jgi:hypothetical protein